MAKISFKGLEEYSAKLNRLSALSRDTVIGAAVYDGAAIVADAVRSALDAVPTDEGHGSPSHPKLGPTEAQKESLKQGLGVAPLRDDNGFLNVKIGFDGYDSQTTPKYPRGHPNQMLARAVQSGTSWQTAHPFMKDAVRVSRKAAEKAMGERVEREINNIME